MTVLNRRVTARPSNKIAACLALLFAVSAAGLSHAQAIRPGDERPELPAFESSEAPEPLRIAPLPAIPAFEPEAETPGTTLPPIALPGSSSTDALAAGERLPVRTIRIRGNTVLPPEALDAIASDYAGRELSFDAIQELRDRLTRAYIDAGFVTSGAVVPDQILHDGELTVEIHEGRLSAVEIETDGRLRVGPLRRKIERHADTPLNVNALEAGLQILQQNDLIEAVHATLVPAEQRGEGILRVRVDEARAWHVGAAGNNYNSPSIGEWRGEARLAHGNVIGFGDSITARYAGGAGYQEVSANYEIPFTPWDTAFELHFRRTWSEVIEEPFDILDITSKTETYGFKLTQPVYRTLRTSAEFFFIGDYRRSRSYLLDEPFSFVLGPIDGTGKVAALRVGVNASYSSRTQAIASRWMASFGLNALGATKNQGDVPDGQFVSLLGQMQWARRFPSLWNLSFVARGDLQVSSRPLLGLEQFSVGGHATVRGYRENQLVRDNGVVGSFELRLPIPLPSWREWRPRFEIAPFVDVGYSWNSDRETIGPKTLASVGVGGRLFVTEHFRFLAYWGHQLKDVPRVGEKSVQDDGFHIGASLDW